jgi:hypothetical protein
VKISLLILIGVTLAVTIGVAYFAQSKIVVAVDKAEQAETVADLAMGVANSLEDQVTRVTETTQDVVDSMGFLTEKMRNVTEILDQYERLVYSWQDEGVQDRKRLAADLRRELRDSEGRQLRSIEGLSDQLLSLIVAVESIDRRLVALSLTEAPLPPPVVDVVDVVERPAVPCPTIALNADAKKSILRRAMERAPDTGTHVVSGSFTINNEGKTVGIEVTSNTAPARLRTAVRKYLDALVWGQSVDGYTDCSVQLRLEVS